MAFSFLSTWWNQKCQIAIDLDHFLTSKGWALMVEMHEIHVLFQDCIAPRISVGVGKPKCCHCCCCRCCQHCCWGWLRYKIYNHLERAMVYIVSSWKAVRWCWQAQVLPSAESPPARHTGLHSSFLETKLFIFLLTKNFMRSQYENTGKQQQRRKRLEIFCKNNFIDAKF